jgi:hypothetical protein
MSFTYDVDAPKADGKGTEKVTLELPDLGQIPSGIVRRNRRSIEGFMWDAFEWGLSQKQLEILDRLPSDSVVPIYFAWRDAKDADEDEESDDAATSGKTSAKG